MGRGKIHHAIKGKSESIVSFFFKKKKEIKLYKLTEDYCYVCKVIQQRMSYKLSN
jgi:hypothetical protein